MLTAMLSTANNYVEELESANERWKRTIGEMTKLRDMSGERKDSVMTSTEEDDRANAVASNPIVPGLFLISPLPDSNSQVTPPSRVNETRTLGSIPEASRLTRFSKHTPTPTSATNLHPSRSGSRELGLSISGLMISEGCGLDVEDEALWIESTVRERVLRAVDVAFDVCRMQGKFRLDREVWDDLGE